MRTTLITGGLLLSTLVLAGSSLALVAVIESAAALVQATAEAGRNYAENAVQSTAVLALDTADSAAAEAVRDPDATLDHARAAAAECFAGAHTGPYLAQTWGATREKCSEVQGLVSAAEGHVPA